MHHHLSTEPCPHCTGRDGRPKRLYSSEEEARRTARHVERTRGVRLRVYQCDWTWGWHLTSDVYGGW
jgi:hypothetical protein